VKVIGFPIFLALVATNTVMAQVIEVDSTNTVPGVFTYTFRRETNNEVWAITPEEGSISIQSDGVLRVEDPIGWTHTVDSSGFINWTVTNGIEYIDEPITFTVTSCLREVQTYPPLDPHMDYAGVIVAAAYELPGYIEIGAGFVGFNYIGPVRTPLTIQFAGTNLLLSWPVSSSNFVLQAASSLDSSAGWSTVTNQPVINSSNVLVTVGATNTCFFRLMSPCSLP
jgi:hypothetical protein